MSRAFTLVEVLAVVLVLALGLAATIAVLGMANRLSRQALARYGAVETAWSLVCERTPIGLTADAADADGDGWRGSGDFAWTGAYQLTSAGTVNGFYAVREEVSDAADIVTVNRRWALVTVEVFEGGGGGRLTQVKERILREGGGP